MLPNIKWKKNPLEKRCWIETLRLASSIQFPRDNTDTFLAVVIFFINRLRKKSKCKFTIIPTLSEMKWAID